MSRKIRIVVHGACGKMGRQIVASAVQDGDFQIVGAAERAGHPLIGQDIGVLTGLGDLGLKLVSDLERCVQGSQVIIDFSSPESSLAALKIAAKHKTALVVGTTGFSADEEREFQKHAKEIACVRSPNMSAGVNLLFKLVNDAASILKIGYDVEIVEAHHRAKKDAPSGTAKKILEIIARVLGRDPQKDAVSGREGRAGARMPNEIGVFSVRAGDIFGDHTVLFAGEGERLELIHRAHSREPFARGALRAASFAASAKPGLYTMQDVLGIG